MCLEAIIEILGTGLMRHACLVFMLVSDNGLEQGGDSHADRETRERIFMDCNSSVFQSCGRVP